MLVRLSDERLVPDLEAHFFRSGFTVERLGGSLVQVIRPLRDDDAALRREIAAHLRIWEATNPNASVDVLP